MILILAPRLNIDLNEKNQVNIILQTIPLHPIQTASIYKNSEPYQHECPLLL